MHGTDEFRLAVAPAHAPGNGQARQGVVYDAGQQFGGAAALLHGAKYQPAALVRLQDLQLAGVHVAGTGEALRGRGRFPVGVIGGVQGRAAFLRLVVLLACGHPGHGHRQAPRRGVPAVVAVSQLVVIQTLHNTVGKGHGQLL